MKAERWRQVEELYHAALEREPDERAEFLAQACAGDEALRCEVHSMLRIDEQVEDFIEVPALEVAARFFPPAEANFEGSERFSIQRRLGEGGFGIVYQAYDKVRSAVVALKFLRHVDATTLYRFKREFRDLADITHPNLISLYELFSNGEQWFFTMELVKGVDFLQHVRGDSNLKQTSPTRGNSTVEATDLPTASTRRFELTRDSDEPAGIEAIGTADRNFIALLPSQLQRLREGLRQLAEGLCTLHGAGILHCDIKPSNVLVTDDRRVVLLDFGLIIELDPHWLRQDLEPHIVGTPAYMSPEQGAGLAVTEASDWYSLGVMLYEALTGRLPFLGSYQEILFNKQKFEPPAPSAVVPGVPEDLNELCRNLLHRNPQARPSGDEVLSLLGGTRVSPSKALLLPSRPKRGAPFIGRQYHLAALTEALQSARAGQAAIIYLHGSSGMGKSALARRFLKELQQGEESLVLDGRCYEQESVPYKGFDTIVDALSQYLKSLPPAEAEALLPDDFSALARVFSVLRSIDVKVAGRRSVVDIPDSQELRKHAFAALRKVLTRLAARKSLVVFIDDLQWGDIDSAALLVELLQPPNPPALLLIACYRSEETETSPFLKKFLQFRTVTDPAFYIRELIVDKLNPAEAQDLAFTLMSPQGQVELRRAKGIAEESGGNPFFIDELVRYSHFDLKLAQEVSTTVHQTAHTPSGEIRLDKVIEARISRLPQEARQLLEVVAVAGRPVTFEVVKQACELKGDEQTALITLRSSHLIRSRETEEEDEIETYHDRIRETIIASLATDILKTHHYQLAQALAASSRSDPETLAMHYQGAEEYEKASSYAVVAAARASEALAFDRAARLYRLALELWPLSAAEARPLRVKLGEALANAGQGAEAGKVYLAAAEGAGAAESVELQRRAAHQLLNSGHLNEGLSVIRNVLSTVGMKMPATPLHALPSLLLRRAWIRIRGLAFRERQEAQISAEEIIRIDTCWSVAQGLSMIDTLLAAGFQTRHLLFSLRSGDKYRIARALAVEAGYYAIFGGRERARTESILRTASGLAESLNHPHAIGLTKLVAGMAAFLRGEWREAGAQLGEAEEILRKRCTGVAWELATARLMWSVSMFFSGEVGELCYRLPIFLKNAELRGDIYEATDLRIRISHVGFLTEDEPEKARREVHQAIEQWGSSKFYIQHWWSLIAEVEIALYSGQGKAAWDLISKRWPALSRSLLLRVQYIRIESWHHRAQGALAAAVNHHLKTTDRTVFLQAAERDTKRIERERMPWGDPLARLIRAGIAVARGEIKASTTHLLFAEAGFEAAGMSLYAAAARCRRGELIGGDQGREILATNDAWMRGQQIKNPSKVIAMLAPGQWSRN